MSIHQACKAQMASLLAKEVGVPKRYADFLDVLLKKSTAVVSNCFDINKHAINLEPDKQLSYKSIYSLGVVELKILKTYIKANLANEFI